MFIVVWVGSGVVTLNSLLLKGKISFFQSVCVLGYCIFPLVIAAFVSMIVGVRTIKLILVFVALWWSTGASVGFMSDVRLQILLFKWQMIVLSSYFTVMLIVNSL